MAVKDVTRDAVESALAEFRRTNLQAMLERYGGGPSTKWYVQDGNLLYDQKLVVRAAHVLQGLGDLYPWGPGSFDAAQALSLLDRLDYRVVSKLSPTNANLEGPSATEPLARWLPPGRYHPPRSRMAKRRRGLRRSVGPHGSLELRGWEEPLPRSSTRFMRAIHPLLSSTSSSFDRTPG